MSIKVVHINSRQAQGSHREYCGRAGRGQEGILGNPFWMNDESKRDEDVIDINGKKPIKSKKTVDNNNK